MIRRRATVLAVLASGGVLLGGLLLAPLLQLRYLVLLTGLWYLALAVLLWAAVTIIALWLGRRTALVLVGLAALSPIALTIIRPAPSLALRLPCPRNWAWPPTWFLRSSPMGLLRIELGEVRAKLCYGRPASRGRRMLGGSRVPFGRLWRTGANEPTIFISTAPLEVAGIVIPAGRTSLYTIPGPETWEIILNRSTSQWGIESEYSEAVRAGELGRAILRSEQAGPIERLIFRLEARRDDTADLVLWWETTRVRIPLRAVSR